MSKKKVDFIVNPFAGTSLKENIGDTIPKFLNTEIYDFEVFFTEYAGHGKELAQKMVSGNTDIIVAFGGDGTVNEVASAVTCSEKVFALIPGGSGNGFSMHLGLGRSIKKALTTINDHDIKRIDTCLLNGQFYINVAGLGFDARVAYLTRENNVRGFWQYFTTTIREAKNYKGHNMKIDIDGKQLDGRYVAAVVANASRYGYNFTIAPTAQLTDGVLDVMLIHEASVFRYFLNAYRFLNKTLHKSKLTDSYTGKHIKIHSEDPLHYHLDGEGKETQQSFEFEIVPESLNLLIPREAKP